MQKLFDYNLNSEIKYHFICLNVSRRGQSSDDFSDFFISSVYIVNRFSIISVNIYDLGQSQLNSNDENYSLFGNAKFDNGISIRCV
jgi:hypothetical protein